MKNSIILFVTSFVATALSSMSGGGASVINIPVMLWLGISFPLATAAQKVSDSFWVLPASYNYLKDRKIEWRFLLLFSAIGLVGVYAGVSFVLSADQRVIQKVIGVLMLCLVAHTYFKKDEGLAEKRIHSKTKSFLSYVSALLLGFYESIFGSGNGIIFSTVVLHIKGFDFIYALGYYFAIAFPWVVFAAVLIIMKGFFSFGVMVPVVAGSLIGGYVGSRYAKYKGNRFIKLLFVIIGGILAIKLLFGF